MKETVSRSRTPPKVPQTASFSTRASQKPEGRGGAGCGHGARVARGRLPALGPCGGLGSWTRHLAILEPEAPGTVLHPWGHDKLLSTAGVHVLSLPLGFAPRRPQGRGKQASPAVMSPQGGLL